MISHHLFMSKLFYSSRRRHTRSKRDWSSDVCSSDYECRDQVLPRSSHVLLLLHSILDQKGSQSIRASRLRKTLQGMPVHYRSKWLLFVAFLHFYMCANTFECDKWFRSEERRVGKG